MKTDRITQVDLMRDDLLVYLSDKTFFIVTSEQLFSLNIPRSDIADNQEAGTNGVIHLVKKTNLPHPLKRFSWAPEEE
ncbi:MAG: hypothetical protein ACRYGF_07215 [Janthinobacterium lividum]